MINGLKNAGNCTPGDGSYIVAAAVDINGDLIITLSNGQQLNAGPVRGNDGLQGEQGIQGEQGLPGQDGDKGERGETGATGSAGEQGERGRSFEIDRVASVDDINDFSRESATFAVLMYDDTTDNGEHLPHLWLKLKDEVGTAVYTYSPDTKPADTDFWMRMPFPMPEKGLRGEQGIQGIQGKQGEQGNVGRGLQPDYSGTLEARTNYDSADTGAIFLDVTSAQIYIKASEQHGHWNGPFDMLEGPQGLRGEKGETGAAGVAVDLIYRTSPINELINYQETFTDMEDVAVGGVAYRYIPTADLENRWQTTSVDVATITRVVPAIDVEYDYENPYPLGAVVYFKGPLGKYTFLLYKGGTEWDDVTDQFSGQKGDQGRGLEFDTVVNGVSEVTNFNKKPLGFTALDADAALVYIKRVDYPYPGQLPNMVYGDQGSQMDRAEFDQKKAAYLNMSSSERFDTLWTRSSITKGAKGEQGERGIQGEKGEKGEKGEQGPGFTPNFFGAGLTERDLYDQEPRGTAYLDTTNGTLYFRQSDVAGDWGPGIAFNQAGGGAANVTLKYVSHESSNPLDNEFNEETADHNLLKLVSSGIDHGTGSATETEQVVLLSGSSYRTFEQDGLIGDQFLDDDAAIIPEEEWNHLCYVNWGDLIRPEIWVTEAFDSIVKTSDGVTDYELAVAINDGSTHMAKLQVNRVINIQLRYKDMDDRPLYAHTVSYMSQGNGKLIFLDGNGDGIANDPLGQTEYGQVVEHVDLDTKGKYELEPFICDFSDGMIGQAFKPAGFEWTATNNSPVNFVNKEGAFIKVEVRFGGDVQPANIYTRAGQILKDALGRPYIYDVADTNTFYPLTTKAFTSNDRNPDGSLKYDLDGLVAHDGNEEVRVVNMANQLGVLPIDMATEGLTWAKTGKFRFIMNRS